MLNHFLKAAAVSALGIAIAACGGAPVNNAGNQSKSNTANTANTANSNANTGDITATTKKPPVETSNNAPTVGPVVEAYFEALKKKDDAALQTILSAAYLKKVVADMKSEKKTGIAAYLADYDGIADKPVVSRNERIEGDKAMVMVKGGNYLEDTPFILIKENGAWKWTGMSPDLDGVKQNAPAPNPSK